MSKITTPTVYLLGYKDNSGQKRKKVVSGILLDTKLLPDGELKIIVASFEGGIEVISSKDVFRWSINPNEETVTAAEDSPEKDSPYTWEAFWNKLWALESFKEIREHVIDNGSGLTTVPHGRKLLKVVEVFKDFHKDYATGKEISHWFLSCMKLAMAHVSNHDVSSIFGKEETIDKWTEGSFQICGNMSWKRLFKITSENCLNINVLENFPGKFSNHWKDMLKTMVGMALFPETEPLIKMSSSDSVTLEKIPEREWIKDPSYHDNMMYDEASETFTKDDFSSKPVAGMSDEFSQWKPGDIVDVRDNNGKLVWEACKVLGFHKKYSDTLYIETRGNLLLELEDVGDIGITKHPSWVPDEDSELTPNVKRSVLYKKGYARILRRQLAGNIKPNNPLSKKERGKTTVCRKS